MDTARPDLYRQNPFRLLELAVEASPRDISRRKQIVEMALNNKVPVQPGPVRLLPIAPAPDVFAVRDGAQRLDDPERRLLDELFWFWPQRPGESRSDDALQCLAKGDEATAEKTWRTDETQRSQSLVSTHNLAILFHIRALEQSSKLPQRNPPPEHEADAEDKPKLERELWEETFLRWGTLLVEEGFWSRLTARIRELDDPRLTTGTARRIRSALPTALLLINAKLAVNAAERADFDYARQQLAVIRASGFSEHDCDAALRLAAEPVRGRIKLMCQSARSDVEQDAVNADKVVRRLLDQAKPLLAVLDCALPESHLTREAAHDEVASAALDCKIAYGRKTENWKVSLDLAELILPVAAGVSIKAKLDENRKEVKALYEATLCWFCQQNKGDEKAGCEAKMHGEIERISNRLRWSHITIKIPRCKACKSEGAVQIGFVTTGLILGLLAGIGGCAALVDKNDSPDGIVVFFLAVIVLPLIGWLVSLFFQRGGVRKHPQNEFPRIKELLQEGWKFGDKPEGVQ